MPYIHEDPEWPNLRWDDGRLLSRLAEIRHRQGRLLGRMEGLGFRLRAEASLTHLRAVDAARFTGWRKLDGREGSQAVNLSQDD